MEELEITCRSGTACKGKSCLLLKTRNGCCESSETQHVILLITPNGHSDINRTTDPKHKTSLSWGTKRHFCLSVNPCYRVVMSQACMRFFIFFKLAFKVPHGKLPRQWTSVSVSPVWSALCQLAEHSMWPMSQADTMHWHIEQYQTTYSSDWILISYLHTQVWINQIISNRTESNRIE